MSLYDKIKTIAETMTGYNVIVDTSNGANFQFDKLVMPAILILIQQSGKYNTRNSHYRDSPNIRIVLFNKIPKGFENTDVDTIKETLKTDLVKLHHKIRYNFDFKINTTDLAYDIVYDEYDANLIGIVMNDTITERVGINLACSPAPQPQQFIVTIKDQDGNILKTFYSSGEYTVNTTEGAMIATQEFIYGTDALTTDHVPNGDMVLIFAGASFQRPVADFTYVGSAFDIPNPPIEIGDTITIIYTHL